MNITINILGHKRKSNEREMDLYKLYRGGISQFRVWIQEMEKHGMFKELNCMLFYLYNIFYRIVGRSSLISGCRYG